MTKNKDKDKFIDIFNIPGIETVIYDELPDNIILVGEKHKETGKLIVNAKYYFTATSDEDNKGD